MISYLIKTGLVLVVLSCSGCVLAQKAPLPHLAITDMVQHLGREASMLISVEAVGDMAEAEAEAGAAAVVDSAVAADAVNAIFALISPT